MDGGVTPAFTEARLLCLNPQVAVHDNVFDAALADHVIELARDGLTRSSVLGVAGPEAHSGRTSHHAALDQWADPKLTALVERLSALVRLPPENCEPAKVIRYTGEEKFDLHQDAFSGFSPGVAEALSTGGQRLFTTLCYLNDVDAGGATEFPRLKLAVRPRLGRVLAWANTMPGSDDPHPHSAHIGQPVESGEKWVLSLWWRQHLYHKPRSYPEEDGPLREV